MIIRNLCDIVPDGIIVFFSSYVIMNFVINLWRNERKKVKIKGKNVNLNSDEDIKTLEVEMSLLESLNLKKRVFLEERSRGGNDGLLKEYKDEIDKTFEVIYLLLLFYWFFIQLKGSDCHGSMLFCVIGGKMSEGINFSDGYSRFLYI
jgi:chromosome transmission fidelity protein 1